MLNYSPPRFLRIVSEALSEGHESLERGVLLTPRQVHMFALSDSRRLLVAAKILGMGASQEFMYNLNSFPSRTHANRSMSRTYGEILLV